MKKRYSWIVAILFILSLTTCTPPSEKQLIRLAISKAIPLKKYQHYVNWIHSVDSTIVCIDMYGLGIDSALQVLKQCDGLLITGGEDIDPAYYNELIDTMRCDLPNPYRDSLDFALIDAALTKGLPVMGICRGLQFLNVSFGGSLYFDIPTDIDTIVKHRYKPYKRANHPIKIEPNSMLFNLSGLNKGITNSNHHQGIKKLGDKLNGVAFTSDGLTEAIELVSPDAGQFFLGVQWHPERMDYQSPLSGNIARSFADAMKKRHLHYNQ